jgi:sec-independent protein translocase protein TatB
MDSIFGIGLPELFFIAIIALIVLGPERLPGTLRQIAKSWGYVRNLGRELTSQFSEEFKALEDLDPRKILNELADEELAKDLNLKTTPKKPATTAKPATGAVAKSTTTTAKPASTTAKSTTTPATAKKTTPAKPATAKTTAASGDDPTSKPERPAPAADNQADAPASTGEPSILPPKPSEPQMPAGGSQGEPVAEANPMANPAAVSVNGASEPAEKSA